MAEFQKVMEQWRRFCKSHDNCGECEFDGRGICGEAHMSDVPYSDMELRIMAWAAEHPEPVYPTWGEYIKSITGLDHVEVNGMRLALTRTIPADIAQKLGIEPKEA